jgi:hypothetical protein
MPQALPPEKMGAALASISAWRLDSEKPVKCPVCSAAGLTIIDQSSRPYAEWYALSCAACGLVATVHIPLGPPM